MTESTAADTLSNPVEPSIGPGNTTPGNAPDTDTGAVSENTANATAPGARKGKSRPPKSDVMPVLEKLAALYPALFGAQFLPLKRGIFQDILEASPDTFEREALKAALSMHTRSTRYLSAVSSGQQRHDLLGQPVEAMAPEHVHHALLEVFRRRPARTPDDLRPKLRQRIAQVFLASGMSAVDYADLVRSRDDESNALLDEALADAQAQAAKSEALQRAYSTSGKTVEAFAAMYGLDPQAVARTLAR